ncbi:collagenase [Pseudoalteromonas rubra]|uniref:microbial collagenase n=1 Tax=Pseudoalteromonas rubra TaxID=43658 RepID=A0A5S3WL81_9GAMM|nr:collagenase [Pseudoalteromonas rubra]TMP28219.1 collagenase [Pseudoalteromonas rubra]TMP34921.1 collagenase [Pseudoalteromonas rubra]
MKIKAILAALPLLCTSVQATQQQVERQFKPLNAADLQLAHGDEGHNHTAQDNAPTAARDSVMHSHLPVAMHLASSQVDVASSCDLAAFANASASTIVAQVSGQGASCVNDLFSAPSDTQVATFTTAKMLAVAAQAKTLSVNYSGTGSADLEAFFLFIRAGFYVEFYNDSVTFDGSVQTAVKDALDAFVANSHFYDNNDAHGEVLSEVITTMDSSELQHVYLPVVKAWLSRWSESYATSWHMRGAVNGIFTVLFRGQWNSDFVALIGKDAELVNLLANFTKQSWMLGSDAEFMIINAGRELARLKNYTGTSIQPAVDTALKSLFSTYQSYGYGDGIWLGAADIATYYADCSDFGICGFKEELVGKALSQSYQCSSTIRIRSQEMTQAQHLSACDTMAAEETRFHTMLETNQTPVADDNNTMLQVNIFNSSADYKKYAGPIFGINTDNGGMYLEGDPSVVGNQANFIAYEASYAKADHYVWNLEHEYVHYLDGRFDLYGDFNAPTEAIVWWSEGVAEYVANLNDNQDAIDTIKDGSTYQLGEIFETTYDGFDQDRIYRWGYLAVRFMIETHKDEVNAMLGETRVGNWSAYKARMNNWAAQYDNEFTQWTQQLAGDTNQAPTAVINGPYQGTAGASVSFSSQGSSDPEGQSLSYAWQFGDGGQSTQADPVHTYQDAGSYTVTLTVTDNQGLAHQVTTQATISADQGIVELQNGKAVPVAGAQDELTYFKIQLPAGATNLTVSTSDGSGDVDLYLRHAQQPTLDTYDCRPYVGGNAERCDVATPKAGEYYIMLRGYNAYADVNLIASYTAPVAALPDTCVTQGSVSGGRLSEGVAVCMGSQDPMWFSLENVSGQQSIRIETAHGNGDLTLEYSNQGWPNDNNVEAGSYRAGNSECINLSEQSQYWGYLKVSGAPVGATVQVTYNDGWCN